MWVLNACLVLNAAVFLWNTAMLCLGTYFDWRDRKAQRAADEAWRRERASRPPPTEKEKVEFRARIERMRAAGWNLWVAPDGLSCGGYYAPRERMQQETLSEQ